MAIWSVELSYVGRIEEASGGAIDELQDAHHVEVLAEIHVDGQRQTSSCLDGEEDDGIYVIE